MYNDSERWSYLFQSYVLLTMMELHHKEVVSVLRCLSTTKMHVFLPPPPLSPRAFVCWKEVSTVLDTVLWKISIKGIS